MGQLLRSHPIIRRAIRDKERGKEIRLIRNYDLIKGGKKAYLR